MSEKLIEVLESICRATGTPRETTARIIAAAKGDKPGPDRPITTRHAAEILECHPKTVHRLAARGMLHPIRRSARCVRFKLSEVERLALGEVGQ